MPPQTRPTLSGRPVALFVFSNLREQKGGLTKAFLRRLAIFHEAGWDTHVATIHPQPEIDETLAAWRARGWLPAATQVHHYQRRNRRFRPAWSRSTDETWTRDDRIGDWLDWLVGLLPGVVVFADSPVTYAPVALMRNPYVARVMTVHLAHRASKRRGRAKADPPERSIYQGPAGTPKLSGRFLPFAPAADVVVALTHRQADHLRTDVPGLDVRVIPNIVDRPDLGDPPARDPRLVVQLGRLDPFKRVDHALRALALARREVPDLRLAVYGRGPDQERLESVADELGLAGAVSFEGFTDDPVRVLASAAASVMTSKREGFGLSVAESLSVGTPVVTYDIDYGPAELVRDGVNGRVVRSGSVPDLAAALVQTVRDAEAWAAMSAAAPAAVDRLQAGIVGAQWLELAEEVASGVELPEGALLVEDLRVTREGLGVAGVSVAREPRRVPRQVGIRGCGLRSPVESEPGSAPEPTVAQEVRAVLPWPDLAAWPFSAELQAVDHMSDLLPTLGPGVPTVAVPTPDALIAVGRDARGALRRIADHPPAVLEVQPEGSRARVGSDVTVVGWGLELEARLTAAGPDGAEVTIVVTTPGLQLDPGSVVPLTTRAGDRRLRVGLLRCRPESGRWSADRWTCSALIDWDDTALADVRASGEPPGVLSLGAGRSLRPLGPLRYGLRRPSTFARGGWWSLAPASNGNVALVVGRGVRARVSAALSLRQGQAKPFDPAPDP